MKPHKHVSVSWQLFCQRHRAKRRRERITIAKRQWRLKRGRKADRRNHEN